MVLFQCYKSQAQGKVLENITIMQKNSTSPSYTRVPYSNSRMVHQDQKEGSYIGALIKEKSPLPSDTKKEHKTFPYFRDFKKSPEKKPITIYYFVPLKKSGKNYPTSTKVVSEKYKIILYFLEATQRQFQFRYKSNTKSYDNYLQVVLKNIRLSYIFVLTSP